MNQPPFSPSGLGCSKVISTPRCRCSSAGSPSPRSTSCLTASLLTLHRAYARCCWNGASPGSDPDGTETHRLHAPVERGMVPCRSSPICLPLGSTRPPTKPTRDWPSSRSTRPAATGATPEGPGRNPNAAGSYGPGGRRGPARGDAGGGHGARHTARDCTYYPVPSMGDTRRVRERADEGGGACRSSPDRARSSGRMVSEVSCDSVRASMRTRVPVTHVRDV